MSTWKDVATIQDEVDVKILEILQRAGRTRNSELAELVGLSLPAVTERLKKLEESGIIAGYYAKLDHRILGKDLTAFVLITVDSSRHYQTLLDHTDHEAEIQECHAVTGEGTHLMKVRTENATELEKLLTRIKSWQGVTKTTTSVVLSTYKESTQIGIHMPTEQQHKKTHHDSKSKESFKDETRKPYSRTRRAS